MTKQNSSPVSYPINVARLPQKGMPLTILADEAQRSELARQHDLLEVSSFHAELFITMWNRSGVKVAGTVKAEVRQECVVTLEPVPATISEEFSQVFLPQQSRLGREGFNEAGEIYLDAEGPDSPEPFSGDIIDVGALAEEFFGLALDPYPRKPGATLSSSEEGEDEDGDPRGPLQEKLLSFTRKS